MYTDTFNTIDFTDGTGLTVETKMWNNITLDGSKQNKERRPRFGGLYTIVCDVISYTINV
jgi:hypothetical protein